MRHHWFARPNELFLDFDSPTDRDAFQHDVGEVLKPYHLYHVKLSPSTTPGHTHVVITFNGGVWLDFADQYALSLALHSDPKREAANLARHRAGATQPVCLIRADIPLGWRRPDWSCNCPQNLTNPVTRAVERLRACQCLREYTPHHYWAGTLP